MSSSDIEIIAIACALEEEPKRKRSRVWVHPINQKRLDVGEFHHLYPDLLKDEKKFFQYFRMGFQKFTKLCKLLDDNIRKTNTKFRHAISVEERVAVCLRFFATGDTFKTIAFSYRLGESTVRNIVYELCDAIWTILSPTVMPVPKKDDWQRIEREFFDHWNFPNCVGSIDGKHVLTEKPPNSGSLYFNYKNTFSIVLLAVVDANYKFIAIDVGAYGKNSDGRVFSQSVFGKKLLNHELNLPEDKPLPGTKILTPHVFVGDEAFPLHENLMRPFPGSKAANSDDFKIFNYQLIRARRIAENCFGILTKKFRIYQRKMQITPEHLYKVVLATCCLHNFLHDDVLSHADLDPGVVETPPSGIQPLERTGFHSSTQAANIRKQFAKYFTSSVGALSWQSHTIACGRKTT